MELTQLVVAVTHLHTERSEGASCPGGTSKGGGNFERGRQRREIVQRWRCAIEVGP